jgi:hypothetical protein
LHPDGDDCGADLLPQHHDRFDHTNGTQQRYDKVIGDLPA